MKELGYVPQPHAAPPRKHSTSREATGTPGRAQNQKPGDDNIAKPDGHLRAETPYWPDAGWDDLKEGDTVELSGDGIADATAAVDAIGADRTRPVGLA